MSLRIIYDVPDSLQSGGFFIDVLLSRLPVLNEVGLKGVEILQGSAVAAIKKAAVYAESSGVVRPAKGARNGDVLVAAFLGYWDEAIGKAHALIMAQLNRSAA